MPPADNPSGAAPYWITWALVIAGWIIVNRQNNKREERKEIRASLNDLHDILENIKSQAIKYHTANKRNENAEPELVSKIELIPGKIRNLGLESWESDSAFISFKQSITLQNFESKSFRKQAASSDITNRIRDDFSRISSILEDQFACRFRKNILSRASYKFKRALYLTGSKKELKDNSLTFSLIISGVYIFTLSTILIIINLHIPKH